MILFNSVLSFKFFNIDCTWLGLLLAGPPSNWKRPPAPGHNLCEPSSWYFPAIKGTVYLPPTWVKLFGLWESIPVVPAFFS